MPGMIPRGARGPGARREGEAHGASARAGARRARQGGRGAGRVPQVRRDAPRVRGARRGRVAEVGPRVLRPHPLAQDHGPARVPRARGGRLGELRRARVRGRDARGVRGALRGVPGHLLARAHEALRGHGPRPCAVRERAHRLLPGRRHVPRRVAGRQAARVGGGDAPGAAALGGAVRERGISNPEACVAGGGRPRRRVLRGRGPGPADRRGARPRPRGPWARERPSRPTASGGTPGCSPRLRVAPRRDARAGGRARRARHGGARRARGPRASWRASGGPAEEARPLPRLVPVGRADEEAGRRQGGHPVGPGGDGGLRQHAVRPREGAAAPLVLLGG